MAGHKPFADLVARRRMTDADFEPSYVRFALANQHNALDLIRGRMDHACKPTGA